MFDKPSFTDCVGIELTSSSLKAVEVTSRGKKANFCRALEVRFDPAMSEEEKIARVVNSEEGKILQSLYHTHLFISSLNTADVLLRPLEIGLTKESEIDQALPFQSENLFPFDLEQALFEKIVLSSSEENSSLTAMATKRELVINHVEKLSAYELDPEAVSCHPATLAQFAALFCQEPSLFILYLSSDSTSCLLIEEGKPIAAKSLAVGFKEIKEDQIETLCLEVTRTFLSLEKQSKEGEVKTLMLTGEGSLQKKVVEKVCADLKQKRVTPQPTDLFDLTPEQLQKYAVPIGAALSGLPSNKDLIDFRQEDLSYPLPWKRFKRPLALFFALSLFLAFTLYLFGQAHLANRKEEIREKFSQLLSFSEQILEKGKQPDPSSSPEEWQHSLTALQNKIEAVPFTYSLMPDTPRVSDFLAWLNGHPNIVKRKGDQAESLLSIENITYTVTKRPQKNRMTDKYRVKVSLEFTAPSSTLAREFHDALLTPNPFVDLKEQVQWSVNRGVYKTSFFLKNKPYLGQ